MQYIASVKSKIQLRIDKSTVICIMPPMNDKTNSQTLIETIDASTPTRVSFKLICASKCKKFALEMAQSQLGPTRSKMFTRVSEEFLIACEANLKAFIRNRVNTHPSKGKTLT